MKIRILTNRDIIDKLKIISGASTGSALAKELGTERQNIRAYENKETKDLNNRIISYLLALIKE